ncbi:DUF6441 family protein [Mesorhizobium opportunistum]|uniref:Uncharacterized protein n=1 Tax=Mesorhizobium opportunistum (strain LMG 24607 / HAMBI 3007 / WSM2075) TaxID=536019 RepID=F7XZY5_MESOW|nr:DUF6441 family protein [Mesorhizobium opportunistum]AEH88199.1 conserved hypothetical protein [Mesorhizobium opportunistum WSM2075]
MSGLLIFLEAASGQFDKAMEDATSDVKKASMGAAHKAADIMKRDGRADIAAAGFGPKWQNALRVVVYPKNAESIQPTIQTYHKIGYSEIFEEGGSIFGKPLLWLPIEKNLPTRQGLHRVTPSFYVKNIGPLFPIYRAGKAPLLAARVKTGRRNKQGVAEMETVPMFVGIDEVTLKDRFHIREIADQVADQLPGIFAAEFDGG